MLELDRVAKLYGVKVIFKEVSCAFTAGSVSLLVGGNGAGKSTFSSLPRTAACAGNQTIRCARARRELP